MRGLLLAFIVLMDASSAAWGAFAANDLSCSVYAPPTPGMLARCTGPFSGPGGTITIELHGTAPNRVTNIRLGFDDGALPDQTIKLKVKPVIDLETVGVLFMDFNSDGVQDLAVMECLPDGANVPYQYFVFDPSSGRFAANASLNLGSKGDCS